jgi:hypothetical protein
MVLADYVVKQHLKQKRTIGVFSDEVATKFISFDIDYENLDKAEAMALSIVQTLRGEFTLSDNEILLTFSGSKGFHVEVFFNDMIANWKIKQFYHLVLRIVEATVKDVELRPTANQAVKLPLSLNKKTGKKCSVIHKEYLYEMADESILDIRPIDFSRIEEHMEDLINFYPEREEEICTIQEDYEESIQNKNAAFSDMIQIDYIERVLQAGTLIEAHTRHKVVLGIASLFNTQGRKKEEALITSWNIIKRTYNELNHYMDKSWTLSALKKETKRIVELVFSKDIKLGVKAKPVFMDKKDILFIVQAKTQKEREMLLIMLVHAKKYANKEGTFFLTNKQIAAYGGTLNRSRAKKYWESLHLQGLIEVVQSNKYSGRRLLINGKELSVKDPNVFRLVHNVDGQEGAKVENFSVKQFQELVVKFLSKDEIKQKIGIHTYYNHYSKYYK